ncbi:methionine/alanine import family NSS transporter small subunit [Microbacterium sp. APC 3898]|jgi:hypothetical protein|uniref:Methionine/alanine import family NSS transporter small subunit n=2 Tax=Planococcus TaxID=1372 RepID=A0ABT7ZNS8_9BACL|nr:MULTISPECIES: methionine/alanine import family NSS transporter small subunit [Terrabacteria group]MBF6633121.1 methionine/alanine import family NSS transporter small subunit [Planococcus sp. (in: firmicutes)]MBD8016323.1 methionine/alanine import family NSS transporter small subunit [Planococcus wigleyi]MDN3428827.1 methionine/alanine import family NSS transporter small subunit [Planococcus sp. APC 4016]MDN3439343.1 methionine/alanine import family NSS transporter small subunit [Planococcus 
MTVSSIVVMIIGMVIIWGGLAASIIHAVRSSKKNKARDAANNV